MKTSKIVYLLVSFFLLIGLYYVAISNGKEGDNAVQVVAKKLPTPGTLLSRLLQSDKKLLAVYGTGYANLEEAYKKKIEEKLLHLNRLLDITIKSDVEVSVEDLKTTSVFLVGTPTSNRVLARLLPQLPITFQGDGFIFRGKLYQDTTDVITFLYPNPENFQYPLFITTGNQDNWVIKYLLHGLPLGSALGNYEILHQGKLLVYGSFSQDESTRWEVDDEKHHDFKQEVPLAKETDHYRFYLYKNALKFNELELFARE